MPLRKPASARTIRIDEEALQLLTERMLPSESFSSAIKRLLPPAFDMKAILKKTAKNPISDEFAAEVLAARDRQRASGGARRRKAS